MVVDVGQKENDRKRKRKTLLSEKKECVQKGFDRADIVRDVRLADLSGVESDFVIQRDKES